MDQQTQKGDLQYPILSEAINLVRSHVTACEDGVAFVTENVAFNIRALIRKCRKNYWGIFDEPNDPHTNRAKVWVPLTEVSTTDTVKNIDKDQKDAQFRSKVPEGSAVTDVIRAKAIEELEQMNYGEKLDEIELSTAIDGTGIWKITDAPSGTNRLVDVRRVDRLNFYISPLANNLQDDDMVERIIASPADVAGTNWDRINEIDWKTEVPKTDRTRFGGNSIPAPQKYAEIYEWFGYIQPHLVTGKEDDKTKRARMGHIVISGLYDTPIVHLIEFWEDAPGKPKWKPYEEYWCTKVPGRWDGRGVPEKLLGLQLWINTVINLRINKNTLAQLGLIKFRKGSGITGQMLRRLASTGTIPVQNMQDLEQLIVNESGQGSYTDESTIREWARSVTSTYEAATGETAPNQPATNAVLQSKASQSQFQQMKEQFGMFQGRVFNRHLLPRIYKRIKVNDIVRIAQDYDEFDQLVDRIVAYYVQQQLVVFRSKGRIPHPDEVQGAIESARQKVLRDRHLFIKIFKDITGDMCDVTFYMTNESLDTGVLTDKLIATLKIAPEFRDSTIAQIYNLLGLKRPTKSRMPQPDQNGAGAPTPGAPVPNTTPAVAAIKNAGMSTPSGMARPSPAAAATAQYGKT